MKKSIFLFIAISLAVVAIAANKSKVNDSTEVMTYTERKCDSDIHRHQRESGRCICRGRLSYQPKAWYEKVTCPSCHGRGYHKNYRNGWDKCAMCNGKGWYEKWHGAYVCTSCGRMYENW